jgi:hypothetical protein
MIDLEPIAEHQSELSFCRAPFASWHFPFFGQHMPQSPSPCNPNRQIHRRFSNRPISTVLSPPLTRPPSRKTTPAPTHPPNPIRPVPNHATHPCRKDTVIVVWEFELRAGTDRQLAHVVKTLERTPVRTFTRRQPGVYPLPR